MKALEALAGNVAATDASAWPLVYLPAAATFLLAGTFLWLAARPRRATRRRAT